jgi:hypothetical protein
MALGSARCLNGDLMNHDTRTKNTRSNEKGTPATQAERQQLQTVALEGVLRHDEQPTKGQHCCACLLGAGQG